MFPAGKQAAATVQWRIRDLHNMGMGSSISIDFNAREWSQEHFVYQNKLSQGNCCSCSVEILSMVQLQFLKPGMFLQQILTPLNQYCLIKLLHQKTYFSHFCFLNIAQEES